MGTLDGRVALITGGARGMGRTHAVRLAREGADIIVCDRCADLSSVGYPLATEQELEETAKLVAAEGRGCMAVVADVRDLEAIEGVAAEGRRRFGSIDILLANAGISQTRTFPDYDAKAWEDIIGTNLTGVFNSMRAVAPLMKEQRFGRIVATSSMLGRTTTAGQAGYCASKWGVIGLVKSIAQDLAPFGITVNAVAPGNIDTPMVRNEALYRAVRPDLEHPTWEDVAGLLQMLHVQPIPVLPPEDVTEAILFLLRAEHVTGAVLDVSAGASARFTA